MSSGEHISYNRHQNFNIKKYYIHSSDCWEKYLKNELIIIRRIKHVQKNSSFNVPTYNDDDFFSSLESLQMLPFVAYKSYLGFLLIDGIGKK